MMSNQNESSRAIDAKSYCLVINKLNLPHARSVDFEITRMILAFIVRLLVLLPFLIIYSESISTLIGQIQVRET